MDCPSAICLFLALWLRLNIVLKAESKLGSFPKLRQYCKIFLIDPIAWPIVDIMGILGTLNSDYHYWADKIAFYFNMIGGIFIVLMHSIFLYIIAHRIPSIKNNPKFKHRIILVMVGITMNSSILSMGGVYSNFNPLNGFVIVYSSWLMEVYLFLLLNDIMSSMIRSASTDIKLPDV